ncbi:flagellar hook-length control protein FliK [Neobacillus muris]|uniref:flagellar hook-length control protein FliK n=1 Tax=Neobacillus muris TaxID=2941334 RepID=UPI00204081FC|nr:flagellar hook-length control protein FliK [Neobacillus muris]
MDINQIFIKNIQTNKLDGISSKGETQSQNIEGTSFGQILAKFASMGQKQSVTNQESTAEEGFELADTVEMTEEDWKELDDLLTAILSMIQQVSNPLVTQNEVVTTETGYLPLNQMIMQNVETNSLKVDPSSVQRQVSLLPEAIGETLESFLQKLDEKNLLIKSSQSRDNNNMENIINKLLDNQSQLGIPTDLAEKMQQLIGSLEVKPLNSSVPFLELGPDESQFALPITDEDAVQELVVTDKEEPTLIVNQPLSGTHERNTAPAAAPPTSPLPVSQFVPEVSEWFDRYMKLTDNRSGGTVATLSLSPEHLGDIQIKILSEQGQVSAQIVTDTSAAKDVLEGQLQQLRQAMQQQGLQIQRLEIIYNNSQPLQTNQAALSFSQGGFSSSSGQRQNHTYEEDIKKHREKFGTEQNESIAVTYGGSALRTASQIDFTA